MHANILGQIPEGKGDASQAPPRGTPRASLGEFFFQALGLEFRVKGLGFSVQAFRRGVVEQSIFVTAYGKH